MPIGNGARRTASLELRALILLEELELAELRAISAPAVSLNLETELAGKKIVRAVPFLPHPTIRPLRIIVVHGVDHNFCAIFVNGNQGELKIGDLGLATLLRKGRCPAELLNTDEAMAALDPDDQEEESYMQEAYIPSGKVVVVFV